MEEGSDQRGKPQQREANAAGDHRQVNRLAPLGLLGRIESMLGMDGRKVLGRGKHAKAAVDLLDPTFQMHRQHHQGMLMGRAKIIPDADESGVGLERLRRRI